MLLPIKNMRCLPTIKFKDPVTSEDFELSLEWPYKLNTSLIIEYGSFQHSPYNYMYLKNECGHMCCLPSDYISVFENALDLDDNILGRRHAGLDDIIPSTSKIIRKIKEQCDSCTRSDSHVQNLNRILRNECRYGASDIYLGYECILYDTVENIAILYNHSTISRFFMLSSGGFRTQRLSPPIQLRGRRAELYNPADGCVDTRQIEDETNNYESLTTTATENRSESHSITLQMNERLRGLRAQAITFPSTAHRNDEDLENTALTATASNRSELDITRERIQTANVNTHAYASLNSQYSGFSTGHTSTGNSAVYGREYYNDFHVIKDRKCYIHPFNYVPEYIKHFMPGESEDTTLLLGAEIEVGGNDNVYCDNDKEPTVKKCIQIMNESDSDKEELIYSTHDSTVQIEFDTMPCSLEFHKNKMNYREMFEYLDKEGYKGHDCETAGLHIHANRSYLGKSRISQELVISKILYILEKFNDEICVIARRNNDYSQFAGEGSKEDSLVELYGKYKDKGKRAALNLQHKDTIEFRMFKSTLKYETFILTLEFVKDIIDYAKSVDVEEIELAKWSDLMNCFSPELREYYEFRYKKKTKDINSLTVKQIRRQISKLKSELRNSRDFFQKTKLQQEICGLEKEYKEINRNIKRAVRIKRKIAESESSYFPASMPVISTDRYRYLMRELSI